MLLSPSLTSLVSVATLQFLFQRGLPYLFIALALCNGIYFAYALLTGHFVDQFQVLDQ